MKISAVISEFNPFHNGHKYLIEQVRAESGNTVAAIMSGSLTQRGEVAVEDKFKRAEVAVKNGVDLVLELPTVYACSPAEFFAKGGVMTARALGITEKLFFGAEDADLGLLTGICEAYDSEGFKTKVKSLLNGGEYYPRAVEKALCDIAPEYGEVISKPNNILAVEYIRALRGSGIAPFAVRRIGAGHDEMTAHGHIASASLIRERILSGEDYSELVPDYKVINPADTRNLERVLLFCIRNMAEEQLRRINSVNEGIENRIIEAARRSASLDELLERIKTKRYTMARIKRILCSAMVGITREMSEAKPPYIRVLAFNSKGAAALREISKLTPVPLITNVADGYKGLSGACKEVFDVDIRATDLQALAKNIPERAGADFTNGVVSRK